MPEQLGVYRFDVADQAVVSSSPVRQADRRATGGVQQTGVHTGEADTPKQVDKYAFLDDMDVRLDKLRASVSRKKGHALVCGDLNVAHREVDIKNWRGNRGKAGFLEDERAHFDLWLARHWVDLGRAHGGEGPGPYTWWSWRGKGFDTTFVDFFFGFNISRKWKL